MSDSTFNALLTQTCTIYRRVYDASTEDKWGASSESFSTITSTESCLLQQLDEMIEFTRRGEKIYTKTEVYMKYEADIEVDDILEFESRKYSVLSVDDSAGQQHHKEVLIVGLEN